MSLIAVDSHFIIIDLSRIEHNNKIKKQPNKKRS